MMNFLVIHVKGHDQWTCAGLSGKRSIWTTFDLNNGSLKPAERW